jgi:hypothetical protein
VTDWRDYDDREKVPLPERDDTAGGSSRSPTDAVVEVLAEDQDSSAAPTDADDDREKDPLPDRDE